MQDVYPEFAADVDFYAVGQDPTETLDELEQTRRDRVYPWPVAQPSADMIKDLRVLQESTKVAFDANGVIVYRKRGGGDNKEWGAVFRRLAESAAQ